MSVTSDFLRALFDGVPPGFILLWTLPGSGSKFVPTSDLDLVAGKALALDASGKDVYIGLSTRKTDLGSGKRGTKKQLSALPVIWADIDLAAPGSDGAHAATNLPRDVGEALDLLVDLPPPTLFIDSGHGLHVYWIIDRFFIVDDKPSAQRYETIVHGFQERIQRRAQERGFHLDMLADATRVLRIPGTHNRKIPGDVREVRILDASGPILEVASLGALPPLPAAPTSTGAPDPGKPAPLSLEDEEKALARVARKLRGLKTEKNKELVARVLKGEPMTPGARDAEMQRLASILAWVAPDVPALSLLELLRPTLHTTDEAAIKSGASRPSDEWAIDKLERAQEDAREKFAEEREEDRKIRLVLSGDDQAWEHAQRAESGDYEDDNASEDSKSPLHLHPQPVDTKADLLIPIVAMLILLLAQRLGLLKD